MKKNLFFIPLAALALASCTSGTDLTINGKIVSEAENVYIISSKDKDTLAVAPLQNGAFTVTIPVAETGFIYVSDGQGSIGTVIAEPGKVTYTQDEKKVNTVTGAPLNDAYQAYRTKFQEIYDEYRNAADEAAAKAADAKMDQLDKDFFENNVSNWLGLYALQNNQYGMTGEELEAALDKLAPEFAEDEVVVNLRSRVDVLKKTAVGQPYINITLPTPEGKEISLSDYIGEGKYVLVDFWASWCGPCMGEVPYLVKDYAKYHSKGFEIFGVSLDRSSEPWVKAIADNKMDWIHVSDLQYWKCAPAADYGVNSIPANFLLDGNGTIIAKNLRGEAVSEKLAELLGE